MKFKNFDEFRIGTKVKCPTEEDALVFLKEAKKQGYSWNSGNSLTTRTYWDRYKSKTCYELYGNKTILFGNIENTKDSDEIILNLSEMFEATESIDLNKEQSNDKQNIIDLIKELDNLKQQRDKINSDINELVETIEKSIREFSNK